MTRAGFAALAFLVSAAAAPNALPPKPRTPDHTAVTVVVPLLLSGTATVSVVGMRPVEGGTCSLYVNEA